MSFFPPKTLELTVALIKPHAAKLPPVVEFIKDEILNKKFFIVRYSRCLLNKEHAAKMYAEHEGKSFYNRLISMMTSGPIESFVLARENGIKTWRNMMGPTRTFDAIFKEPDCFRATFGLSNTRNATHGSDSPTSAERESKIYFPDLCFADWYKDKEIYYRNGYVKFDDNLFVHLPEECDVPKNLHEQKKC